jgi:hypothetical protein
MKIPHEDKEESNLTSKSDVEQPVFRRSFCILVSQEELNGQNWNGNKKEDFFTLSAPANLYEWLNSSKSIIRNDIGQTKIQCKLGVVHKWRHGLRRGRGSIMLWQQHKGLSNKKRDDGKRGVKKSPNLPDVIYGRPLTILVNFRTDVLIHKNIS